MEIQVEELLCKEDAKMACKLITFWKAMVIMDSHFVLKNSKNIWLIFQGHLFTLLLYQLLRIQQLLISENIIKEHQKML